MDATSAARELYSSMRLPYGAVSVIAWPDAKSGHVLKVWVSSMEYAMSIPRTFHGYKVKVELRPTFQAHSAHA